MISQPSPNDSGTISIVAPFKSSTVLLLIISAQAEATFINKANAHWFHFQCKRSLTLWEMMPVLSIVVGRLACSFFFVKAVLNCLTWHLSPPHFLQMSLKWNNIGYPVLLGHCSLWNGSHHGVWSKASTPRLFSDHSRFLVSLLQPANDTLQHFKLISNFCCHTSCLKPDNG